MIRFFLLPALLICYCAIGQSNTTRVFYEMKGQPDSTDKKSSYVEVMVLDVGNGFSVFQSLNKYRHDSILNSEAFQQKVMSTMKIDMRELPKAKNYFSVEKDRINNFIVFKNSLVNNYFKYNTSFDSIQWKIFPDTATISGFLCNKAMTKLGGRDYIAWYFSEISIPDGPYKFCNLPGLILKIADVKDYYTFTCIGIEYNSKAVQPVHKHSDKFVLISRNEYFDFLEKIKRNPELLINNESLPSGIQIKSIDGSNMSDALRASIERAKENMRKKNNPLEFK